MHSGQRVREVRQHYWRSDCLPHLELRSTFDSTQSYKAHSHAQLSLGVVTRGQTCLMVDTQECLIGEGDLVVIEPEKVHACNPIDGKPRSYHMLYIDTSWCLHQLAELYNAPVEAISCENRVIREPTLNHLFVHMVERLHHADIFSAQKAFNALAFSLLAHWCSPVQKKPANSNLALAIKKRTLEALASPPDLKSLASEFGCSQETIIRAFRKAFGTTPRSFINNARVEKAKLSLKTGDDIVGVSTKFGFADQSQFHKAFVNYTASTPRQYQKAVPIFDNNL